MYDIQTIRMIGRAAYEIYNQGKSEKDFLLALKHVLIKPNDVLSINIYDSDEQRLFGIYNVSILLSDQALVITDDGDYYSINDKVYKGSDLLVPTSSLTGYVSVDYDILRNNQHYKVTKEHSIVTSILKLLDGYYDAVALHYESAESIKAVVTLAHLMKFRITCSKDIICIANPNSSFEKDTNLSYSRSYTDFFIS